MEPKVIHGSAGWSIDQRLGIQVLVDPDGVRYIRARNDEIPDVVIQPKTPGLPPTRLVFEHESGTLRRAARKARRDKQALRARGYDV